VPPAAPTAFAASTTSNPTTPRFALSYQLDTNNLFYFSASKGFRAGGGNANLPNGCTGAGYREGYQPDWVWSYEIGAKNTLLDNRLQLASSVYHINWSNIQSLVQAFPCGISYVENTGTAAVNGFDVNLQALLTSHLRFDAKVSYTNAYYTQTTYNGTSIAVEEGDKIGFLPQVIAPWNLVFAAQYKVPLTNGNTIHLRVEDEYNSKNPGPFQNGIVGGANYVPLLQADPATNLVKARLGFTSGRLEASLFADNVFDRQPLIGKVSYFSVSSGYRAQYSTFRPRTLGLSVSYSFLGSD
jgi:iron complex outermembrane recepter protein